MTDINAELDAFLASQKPQDPANGAEGASLQEAGKQLENVLPPVEVPPPAVELPAETPALAPGSGLDVNSELDAFLANSQGLPATEAPAPVAEPQAPQESGPGWGDVVSGGLQRGVAQLASAPVDIAGIAAAASGDEAAAQAAFEKARAIESYAPKGYYNFEDIHDFDSFGGWLVEGLAEQAPVLASIMSGGGVGALGARLVAKGLVKNPGMVAKLTTAGAATGAGAVGVGLETAGAGSEFKQRTGDYNPERALAVGVANGILEAYGPAKLFAAPAKGFLRELGKGALREGSTELAQELNTAANAAYIDENYDFFSRETVLRGAEAALLGTAAGGLVTGGVRGAQELTNTVPEEPPVNYDDKSSWGTALTALRDRILTRRGVNNDNVLEVPIAAKEDPAELSPVFRGIRKTWDREGITESNVERIAEFEDAMTPRYVVQGDDGKWGSLAMTSTELEEYLALQAPTVPPVLKRVDLRTLRAGGITADAFDLPTSANDSRIFFAPWVKEEAKGQLLAEYQQLAGVAQQLQTARFGTGKEEARAKIQEIYAPLAAKGLRVIPSRGASFVYKGDFVGSTTNQQDALKRTYAVTLVPRASFNSGMNFAGTKFKFPRTGQVSGRKTVENTGYVPVALDFDKLDFEDGFAVPSQYETVDSLSAANKYVFRKDIKPEQKAALIEAYRRDFVKTLAAAKDEGRFADDALVGFAKKQAAKGIQFNAVSAEQYVTEAGFSGDKFKKLVVGRYTPAEARTAPFTKGNTTQSVTFVDQSTRTDARAEMVRKATRSAVKYIERVVKELGVPGVELTLMDRAPYGASWISYNDGEKLQIGIDISQILDETNVLWNGEQYIEASTLNTIFHELGHHVTLSSFQKLPAKLQNGIYAAYERARLRHALTGDTSLTHHLVVGKYDEFQPGYSLTFSEYLAEQFRRYATSNEIFNPAGAFYRSLGQKFGEIAKVWWDTIGPEKATNMFYPTWEFRAAITYLEQVAAEAEAANAAPKQEAGIVKSAFGLPETIQALEESVAYRQTAELVSEWRKSIPSNVDVTIEPGRSPEGRTAEYIANDPLTGRATIRLWVGSMQNPASSNAVAHEATHAVWDLLTEGERAILTRVGRREKVLPGGFESKYFRDYKAQLKALGFNEQEANVGARKYVDEEYAAWLVGKRFNGVDYGSEANGLLDKILELLRKVGNLLRGNGFNSVREITRRLYSGEIAGRISRRVDRPPSVVKSEYNDGSTDGEYRVHKLGGNVYAIESILWDGDGREFLFVKYGGPVKGSLERQLSLVNQGERIGKIDLSRQGSLGYEVDMVDIVDRFKYKNSKVDYSDQFYKYLSKYLGQEMRPSGMLYDPGYRMWKRRNPASVAYHQWSEVDGIWYSPKRILKNKALYEDEAKRQAANKGIAENKTSVWPMVVKYRQLYSQVPAEAWTDPGFAKSFNRDPREEVSWELQYGMLKAAGMISDGQFEQAVTGQGEKIVDPYMAAMAEGEAAGKARNARVLGIEPDVAAPPQVDTATVQAILGKWGINNPQLNPMLSGPSLGAEADRISWFTKLFLSIKQMAWNNPHIQQLRDYVAAKDEMNAMRMKWIERAEESVRDWDSLPSVQRDKLTDLLFWATEMQYLQPNDPPRLPTQQEVASQAQATGMTAEALAMYYQVQRDFSDYLVEVEQVLAENIRKEHTTVGANGQLQISQVGQSALASLAADMAAMRMRPYFPMVRFGEFTVTIRDPSQNDKVVWFSAHPTIRERDAAAREIIRRYPAHRMQVGKMEPDVMQFQGLPPAMLKAIKANLPGLTQQQKDAIDKMAIQMAPERSFRKRWLKRNGTSGYSLDGMRVYSHYFQGAAGYLAKLAYKPTMDEAINSLKRTLPLMRDATKRAQITRFMEADAKYSMEPSRDWHKFRSAVSLWQLGFSPAAAFVNLTQTPVFTMPYFAGIYGQRANMLLTTVVKSTKRAIQYSPAKADPQFAAARQILIMMGKLETGAAPELGAYAEGGNLLGSIAGTAAQRKWRSFMRTSMWMFQQAERVNREIVLGLGWELSTDPSHPHYREIEAQYQFEITKLANSTVDVDGTPVQLTYDTAVRLISVREAISRTQFEYSRDYRPPFLRSPMASSFLVFFGYMQSALYAFGKNPGTLQLFLTFAFLFGAMGLPGAEDLEEVINALSRKLFGKDFSIEDKARELVRDLTEGTVFDEVGPDLLLHGISRYGFGLGLLQEGLGTPQFDASANGSMGRVVPALAETARALGRGDDWKSVTAELVREGAGAGFGQIFPMMQFLGSVASGDILSGDWKKWEAVMPRAVKAMSKAGRFYVEGEEHGKTGATIAQFDVRDPDDLATIIAQGFGFTPTQVSMKWDLITKQQDQLKFYANRKSALMVQFSEAIRRKDAESKAEVIKSIQAYNSELRTLGLQSMGITTQGLRQSLTQRAQSARKQELGLPTQTSATPLYQKVEKMFPGIEKVK